MAQENEHELCYICYSMNMRSVCSYLLGEREVSLVDDANRILSWFNPHEKDTAHLRAAALYTDIFGMTGLHHIVKTKNLPFEVISTHG